MAIIKKQSTTQRKTTSVGKEVELLGHKGTAGGDENGTASVGSWEFLRKLYID